MSGKWEVAGKTSKTKKQQQKKQKKVEGSLPSVNNHGAEETYAIANPLKEHFNVYSLYDQTPEAKAARKLEEKENLANGVPEVQKKGAPKPRAKKRQSAPKEVLPDRDALIEQISKIDIEELTPMIQKVKEKFPNHPMVWLKDIQSYFQMKITQKEEDPALIWYEKEYPHNCLPSDIEQFLCSVFTSVSEPVLTQFFIECLNTLAKDVRVGGATYYNRLLLQSMSLNCPKIKNSNTVTNELHSLIEDSLTRPKECVALLWCVQMTPNIKLHTQFRVWFTWMLPLLQKATKKTEKQIQDFIVTSLDSILKKSENKDGLEISPSDFFSFFDLVFSANSNVYPHVRTQLREMLLTVKDIAFSMQPSQRLRSFFPSLLIRLNSSETEQRSLVLDCLVECLQKDMQCWLLWQQMYTKHLNNSIQLLEYVNDQAVVKTLNKNCLKQTLDHIIASVSPRQDKSKVKEAHRRSAEMALDMKNSLGSPFKAAFRFTLLLLCTLTVAYILHDIKEFGSFQKSKTGRIVAAALQHNVVKQVMTISKDTVASIQKYGAVHAPVMMDYLNNFMASISAALTVAGVCVQKNFNYAVDHREEIVNEVTVKTMAVTNTVYTTVRLWTGPEYRAWASEAAQGYLAEGQALASKQLSVGQAMATEYYNNATLWLDDTFIKEPVTLERLKLWAALSSEWLQFTAQHVYEEINKLLAK